MKPIRFTLVALLAAFALALVGVACGGDDETDSTTPTETTDTTTTDDDTADTTDTTDTTDDDTTTETGSALEGSVGPGFVISVSTAAGDPVDTLPAGSYELEIEDLSSAHNFHLTGPGVEVSTEVSGQGTENETVDLQAGTYTFVCDPHATQMTGSFEVT